MLKTFHCPNCGAAYNPANLCCDFCGSYIINTDENETDFHKESFVQTERPADYKGIYLYGHLLEAGEYPVRTGIASWNKSALQNVGGHLALTNKRFIFCADGLNSLVTSASDVNIYLQDVARLSRRTAALVSKRLVIECKDGSKHEFLVYNVDTWLDKGNRALSGEYGLLDVSAPQAGAAARPTVSGNYVDELKQLKELLDAGIITEEEFKIKKRQVLHI